MGVLTREDVEVIYLRLQEGERGTTIARDFVISQQTVSAIKHGRLWSNVTGQAPTPMGKRRISALTEEMVREIDAELQRGVLAQELADRYGVTWSVIHNIKIGRTWTHVTGR